MSHHHRLAKKNPSDAMSDAIIISPYSSSCHHQHQHTTAPVAPPPHHSINVPSTASMRTTVASHENYQNHEWQQSIVNNALLPDGNFPSPPPPPSCSSSSGGTSSRDNLITTTKCIILSIVVTIILIIISCLYCLYFASIGMGMPGETRFQKTTIRTARTTLGTRRDGSSPSSRITSSSTMALSPSSSSSSSPSSPKLQTTLLFLNTSASATQHHLRHLYAYNNASKEASHIYINGSSSSTDFGTILLRGGDSSDGNEKLGVLLVDIIAKCHNHQQLNMQQTDSTAERRKRDTIHTITASSCWNHDNSRFALMVRLKGVKIRRDSISSDTDDDETTTKQLISLCPFAFHAYYTDPTSSQQQQNDTTIILSRDYSLASQLEIVSSDASGTTDYQLKMALDVRHTENFLLGVHLNRTRLEDFASLEISLVPLNLSQEYPTLPAHHPLVIHQQLEQNHPDSKILFEHPFRTLASTKGAISVFPLSQYFNETFHNNAEQSGGDSSGSLTTLQQPDFLLEPLTYHDDTAAFSFYLGVMDNRIPYESHYKKRISNFTEEALSENHLWDAETGEPQHGVLYFDASELIARMILLKEEARDSGISLDSLYASAICEHAPHCPPAGLKITSLQLDVMPFQETLLFFVRGEKRIFKALVRAGVTYSISMDSAQFYMVLKEVPTRFERNRLTAGRSQIEYTSPRDGYIFLQIQADLCRSSTICYSRFEIQESDGTGLSAGWIVFYSFLGCTLTALGVACMVGILALVMQRKTFLNSTLVRRIDVILGAVLRNQQPNCEEGDLPASPNANCHINDNDDVVVAAAAVQNNVASPQNRELSFIDDNDAATMVRQQQQQENSGINVLSQPTTDQQRQHDAEEAFVPVYGATGGGSGGSGSESHQSHGESLASILSPSASSNSFKKSSAPMQQLFREDTHEEDHGDEDNVGNDTNKDMSHESDTAAVYTTATENDTITTTTAEYGNNHYDDDDAHYYYGKKALESDAVYSPTAPPLSDGFSSESGSNDGDTNGGFRNHLEMSRDAEGASPAVAVSSSASCLPSTQQQQQEDASFNNGNNGITSSSSHATTSHVTLYVPTYNPYS